MHVCICLGVFFVCVNSSRNNGLVHELPLLGWVRSTLVHMAARVAFPINLCSRDFYQACCPRFAKHLLWFNHCKTADNRVAVAVINGVSLCKSPSSSRWCSLRSNTRCRPDWIQFCFLIPARTDMARGKGKGEKRRLHRMLQYLQSHF